ncbi:putative response regulatory protein VC_A0850 (plasmid) [Fibrisoma limi BUZ 3]|uniref:Putative response regulatory protein VC_A0850 n=1 Tax=Fibrisoma limi BUZ 3 TaxID=1185876 RepID=I2GTV2_9BACT|nr:LytTR family DNA-binding domain-containing protein [Fibrisoma limi]CCH57553.1 putative response regulatory protein VC_A0850 [Fibrisoma limi BUZ 3]
MNIPQPIRCLVIEDEPLSQELLLDHIQRIPTLKLVGTASNGQIALQKCRELKPDLLLLDIRMPRLSGFELLSLLEKPVPLVVVTTAYREYALKGYEHAVVDFLEKPIFFDRFSLAIHRVEERLNRSKLEHSYGDKGLSEDVSIDRKVLTVRAGRSQVNIRLDNIYYIEALENYVKIRLINAPTKDVVTKISISQLESLLPKDAFIRVHRSLLVRIDQISRVDSSSITLFSAKELPIGRTYRDTVRQAFMDWEGTVH